MGKRTSIILTILSLIFIFAFAIAYAENGEYREYKVIKGDTLWDISSKEIIDPFLWPKIWKENPEIKNPDRISPDQMIRIPLKLLRKEQQEEVTTQKASAIPEPVIMETKKTEEQPKVVAKKIEPVEKSYLADKDLILASGYITDYIADEVKSIGKIAGSPTGRNMFGDNDYVYIKTKSPANSGEKFYILNSSTPLIKHPKTKNKIGLFVNVVGVAEVIGTEDGKVKAKITKAYKDISTGDLLDTFYEVESVIGDDIARKPDISGFVIATQQMRTVVASFNILFIDKGSSNGLEVGDMAKVISIDKYNNARTIGIIQIISLKGQTAAAIVRESESVISKGDEVRSMK